MKYNIEYVASSRSGLDALKPKIIPNKGKYAYAYK